VSPYRETPEPQTPCPRCDVELASRAIADVRVDECSRCAGVFVPATLMPRIIDALDLAPEVIAQFRQGEVIDFSGGPMYVKCPRCKGVMNRRLFAHGSRVIVDVCRGHGVWFDDAELRAVADFVIAGGMERARRHEAAEKRKLAARVRGAVTIEHRETVTGLTEPWSFWSMVVGALFPGRR
jgi:Zn-finger nucleic acid-binding protein